jgi:uncharacterized protein YjbI with pentapeptide repeats
VETPITASLEVETSAPKKQPFVPIPRLKLEEILQQHELWVDSGGKEGARADLSCANLEGADLAGANLQGADLQKANLKKAVLSLADLRGAVLFQANLEEADVLGTELQGASLQHAILVTATGLSVGQFAGANLSGALLPKKITELLAIDEIHRLCKKAGWLLTALIWLCLFTVWLVAATKDVQLIKDSPAFPVLRIGEAKPTVQFYLIAPLLLLGLYAHFHFYLQRLWEGLAGLPAIFPDGRSVEQSGPRMVMALARIHSKGLGGHLPPPLFLEAVISVVLAYWLVPGTLFLLWMRYLTRQDLRGTLLQAFVAIVAAGMAAFLPGIVGSVFRMGHPEPSLPEESPGDKKRSWGWTTLLGAGLALFLLSLGAVRGMPHDTTWMPEAKANGIRKWAADIFWLVGYNPYPDLTETVISTPPLNWSWGDQDLAEVKGAFLNKSSLRYIEAYRAFLVNAHLLEADLLGAYLSEADLRGANLRQANLQRAVLDHARINHANLLNSNLLMVNLTKADLRGANLSHASLNGAILVDARLDDASLYAAVLPGASLKLANLERADLREANLQGANCALADLAGADLWSAKLSGASLQGTKLQNALLVEADLRGVDLHSANLQEGVLRGADLSGANLEDADLRGARGLTANQICSVAGRRNVQLDEELKHEVESLCGTIK